VVGAQNDLYFARLKEVRTGHTVGCGDALLAGFLSGLLRNQSLSDALITGIACGTANMRSLRPGHFYLNDFKKILRTVQIRKEHP